jgi:Flp pilus assembly CpaF family ATPase
MVDARLPDGSRANAVIPPVADGPLLSIRRFGRYAPKSEDLGKVRPDRRYVELLKGQRKPGSIF